MEYHDSGQAEGDCSALSVLLEIQGSLVWIGTKTAKSEVCLQSQREAAPHDGIKTPQSHPTPSRQGHPLVPLRSPTPSLGTLIGGKLLPLPLVSGNTGQVSPCLQIFQSAGQS